MIIVYGIKNCDTCRKALKWLAAEGLKHRFHDYRADGLERQSLETWADSLGWEQLLNRRGTTWRNLADEAKESVDHSTAITLMHANPTLIKRPVFDLGGTFVVGFKAKEQGTILSRAAHE